jgi:hypothetical protein
MAIGIDSIIIMPAHFGKYVFITAVNVHDTINDPITKI